MFRDESSSVPVEEGEIYDVTIQDLARQGDGIARIEVLQFLSRAPKLAMKSGLRSKEYFPNTDLPASFNNGTLY